jgi:Family of unknown function (DUF6141)
MNPRFGGDLLSISDVYGAPAPSARFREAQHFTQWWLWIIVLGVAALAWWAFIQQIFVGKPIGDNPAPDWAVVLIWVVFGLGLPFMFETLTLVVEVMPDAVRVRFRPFTKRIIPISSISHVEARQYNALKEYGGWGIKGWSAKKMAYNVKGHWGVELTLGGDRKVLLGTQRPQELAAAIEPLLNKGAAVAPPS